VLQWLKIDHVGMDVIDPIFNDILGHVLLACHICLEDISLDEYYKSERVREWNSSILAKVHQTQQSSIQ
jgi:hypothetical protein